MSAKPKLRVVHDDGKSQPTSQQAEANIRACRRWRRATAAVRKSETIDRGLKQFCGVFLGAAGSGCRYELVWLSQTSLARKLGYKVHKDGTCSTVRRYISLLRQIGAVTVLPMGMRKARLFCFQQYGHKLAVSSRQHIQNFYKIEYGHPFWAKGKLDEALLANTRRVWREGTGTGPNPHFVPARRRGGGRASETRTGARVPRLNRGTGAPQREELERETEPAPLSSSSSDDQAHPPTPDESGGPDSSGSSGFVGQPTAHHTRSAGPKPRRTCPGVLSHEGGDEGWDPRLTDDEEEWLFGRAEELLAASREGAARIGSRRVGCADPPATEQTSPVGAKGSRTGVGHLTLNERAALLEEERAARDRELTERVGRLSASDRLAASGPSWASFLLPRRRTAERPSVLPGGPRDATEKLGGQVPA